MDRRWAVGGLCVATFAGCNAIFGVGDLTFDGASGGSSTTSTGGGTPSGLAMGGGGEGGMGGMGPSFCDGPMAAEGPGAEVLATFSGPGDDEAVAVAADRSGNAFIAMRVEDALTFGSEDLVFDEVDGLFARLDQDANVVWSATLTGTGEQEPQALAVSADGNVYATGVYSSPAQIADLTLPAPPVGVDACFVLGLDGATGDPIFLKSIEAVGDCEQPDLAVRPDGRPVVTGTHEGALNYDGNAALGTPGNRAGFLLVLEPDGTLFSSVQYDGAGQEEIGSVATGSDGQVVVVGDYSSTVFEVSNVNLPAATGTDGFIANVGAPWAVTVGGQNAQRGLEATMRDDGIALGSFFVAGTTTVGTEMYTASSRFVTAAFDAAGDPLWSWGFNNLSAGAGLTDLAVGPLLDSYVGGVFLTSLNTDGLTPLAAPDQASDGFVVSHDVDGQARWAMAVTGGGNEAVTALAPDCRGQVWIAGVFEGLLSIDGLAAPAPADGEDVFVARLRR